jgi:glycosyltransferase involved in cell wall biosynthesis
VRICLLSYRGHPFGGGQGIYIHNLSKALVNLGHEVDLLSGNPHPVVVDAVRVHKLESLDAYSWTGHLPPEPSRLIYPLNQYEAASVLLGGFPEPLTFSLRAHRKLWSLSRHRRFDVLHDNQCLGLLELDAYVSKLRLGWYNVADIYLLSLLRLGVGV